MREGQLMDIERMREFIVFARTLNFTEAARELHMTQPSLSKHVRDMERDVGVTLVHRGTLTAPNTLTIAGERFADYARQATVAYDDIVEECRRVDAADLPMRIQDVRHVVNVVSNIRGLSSPEAEKAMSYQYVTGTGTLEKMLDDDLVDIAVSLEPTADGAALRAMLSADTYGIIALEPGRFLCSLVPRAPILAARPSPWMSLPSAGPCTARAPSSGMRGIPSPRCSPSGAATCVSVPTPIVPFAAAPIP